MNDDRYADPLPPGTPASGIGKESVVSHVSGFPEWLPEQRTVELKWMDDIRRVFESYGFCSIETPSVEEIEALLAKGETDKEIYAVKRLHTDDEADEPRLGLHYDLTVPLARYVTEHFHDLVFPFKRYQMQRVWRGERPQEALWAHLGAAGLHAGAACRARGSTGWTQRRGQNDAAEFVGRYIKQRQEEGHVQPKAIPLHYQLL